MMIFIAGSLAAILAWLVNSLLVRKSGEQAIIWIIPFGEEFLKTSIALLFQVSIPGVHGIFGLIESVHDTVSLPRWGILAGLSSIIIHWVFGQITLMVFNYTGYWLIGVIITGFVHVLWNYLIINVVS